MAKNTNPPAKVREESAERELARMKTGAVNAGFIQVSRIYIDEMKDLARHAPAAHTVLWTLIQEMNKQNAIMISIPSIGKLTHLSAPTVKRAIALLREQKWMEVLKIGTSNVYRVNASVVWADRADTKWTAFDARLVVNFDEQDEITKKAPRAFTRHIPLVQMDDYHSPIGEQQELLVDE